ncbi:histone-lysine N-methyltransferase SETMAR-like [Crassostrea angulata]|uniref:histone-lysine N-methyltransferase SETMAR-like n=1 Tax=Magallana angulata TaxID=2784310 RepID=UPI0022B1EF24|nr:histone-lysine N-methyltransferase SETMAR-like [Crassostrea angulata]
MQTSKAFIQNFKRGGEKWLDRIITTDETWLHHFDPETKTESSIWKHRDSQAPKKAKVAKSMGKQMYIFFADRHGMILVHAVPSGQTVNAAYYSKVLRRDLVKAIKKKRPAMAVDLGNIILHQDNAPAHTATSTCLEIELLGYDLLEHPPYSPDLAPMDFAIFPFIKSQLRGVRFEDSDEPKYATRTIVSKIDSKWYSDVFDSWLRRCEKCLQCKGDYVEK